MNYSGWVVRIHVVSRRSLVATLVILGGCGHPPAPPAPLANLAPEDPLESVAAKLLAPGPEAPRDFELASDVGLNDRAAAQVTTEIERLAPSLVATSGVPAMGTGQATPRAHGFFIGELKLGLGELDLRGVRVAVLFADERALVAAVFRPARRAAHVVYDAERICLRYFTADAPDESFEGLVCRARA